MKKTVRRHGGECVPRWGVLIFVCFVIVFAIIGCVSDNGNMDSEEGYLPPKLDVRGFPDQELRWTNIYESISSADTGVLARVVPGLVDPSPSVRLNSLFAGYGKGLDVDPMFGWLAAALTHDQDWRVRRMAIQTLSRLKVQDLDIIFVGALRDQRKEVRFSAMHAIGTLGLKQGTSELMCFVKNAHGAVGRVTEDAIFAMSTLGVLYPEGRGKESTLTDCGWWIDFISKLGTIEE